MNTRITGVAIITISLILFGSGFWYVSLAEQALLEGHVLTKGVCVHEEGMPCPYAQLNELLLPKYVGTIADAVLLILGILLVVKKEKKIVKPKVALEGDEKRVFDMVAAEGMIFQSELVERLSLSKVQVTRILDKLEGKGVIERRRRGMTNAVIAK